MNQPHTKTSRLRVRSVRFKKNGCKLHFIHTARADNHADCIAEMRKFVRDIEEDEDQEFAGQVAGYAIVIWTPTGKSRRVQIKCAPDSPLFCSDVPRYASEALQHFYIASVR